MATHTARTTADELLRLPDDGMRRELVRGELREMTPAGSRHGRIAMRLGRRLAEYVERERLGEVYAAETGFRIASDPDTVRAPDLAFVRRERVEAVGDPAGFWPGAPDLAAEVLSPGDTHREVQEKALDYLGAGTRLVLLVDPDTRTVTVYRSLREVEVLLEEDTLHGGDLLPGWRVTVRELFD